MANDGDAWIPRVLVQRRETSGILRSFLSTRVHCSCIAVSSQLICVGLTTGSVHVFKRETLTHQWFFCNKEYGIESLKFSSSESVLAVADCQGNISCWEIEEDKLPMKIPRRMIGSHSSRITELCWDDEGARLFAGDVDGVVTASIIFPLKLAARSFMSKSTVEVIVRENFPIVQLMLSGNVLLVSTTKRSLLCQIEMSSFCQIGSKTRDGKFGACFSHCHLQCQPSVVFAARPGGRLWEATLNGKVSSTHQYKDALSSHSSEIVNCCHTFTPQRDIQANWNFSKLLTMSESNLIITSCTTGLCVIDVGRRKVAGMYSKLRGIQDMCCQGEDIYVMLDTGCILELSLLPLNKCLQFLIGEKKWLEAAKIFCHNISEMLRDVEKFVAVDFHLLVENVKGSSDSAMVEMLPHLVRSASLLEQGHRELCAEVEKEIVSAAMSYEDENPASNRNAVTALGEDSCSRISSNASETSVFSQKLQVVRDIDLDKVVQKTTAAIFSKLVNSGLIQHTFEDIPKVRCIADSSATEALCEKEAKLSTGQDSVAMVNSSDQGLKRKAKVATIEDTVSSPQERSSPDAANKATVNYQQLETVDEEGPIPRNVTSNRQDDSQGASSPAVGGNNNFVTSGEPASQLEIVRDLMPDTRVNVTLGNVSDLVDVTVRTRNAIYGHDLLKHRPRLTRVLSSWVNTLMDQYCQFIMTSHTSACGMGCSDDNVVHIQDNFFKLLGANFSEISSLAMLCFEGDIFPDMCNCLPPVKDVMLRGLSMATFETKPLSSHIFMQDIAHHQKKTTAETVNHLDNTDQQRRPLSNIPHCISDLFCPKRECLSCLNDQNRACFVFHFFPLLNMQRIRVVLNLRQGCLWKTYFSCLSHLEDMTVSLPNWEKYSEKLLSFGEVEVFLACLKTSLEHSPVLAFDTVFSQSFYHWEAALLIGRMGILSTACTLSMLNSLERELALRPAADVLSDPVLQRMTLECALSVSQPMCVNCHLPVDGFILDGNFQWAPLCRKIASLALQTKDDHHVAQLQQICLTNRYLTGYLEFSVNLKEISSCLSLLTKFKEQNVVDCLLVKYHDRLKIDDWVSLLELIQQLESVCDNATSVELYKLHSCNEDNPKHLLSFSSTLKLMTKFVSHPTLKNAVQRVAANGGTLPMELFITPLLDEESSERLCVDKLVQQLDVGVLLPERGTAVSDQVSALKAAELRLAIGDSEGSILRDVADGRFGISPYSEAAMSWGASLELQR